MRASFLFALALLSIVIASPFQTYNSHRVKSPLLKEPVYRYFAQNIDHNNPQLGVFKQRYVFHDFSQPNATAPPPLFLYLGGEGELSVFLEEVYMYDLAKQNGAQLVFLEHRFYGRSQPTGDLTTRSLRLLTVEQALADTANFLVSGARNFGKVVLFGCSYSGALAGWYAQSDYAPQTIVGAFGPSGPYEATLNFTGYLGQFRDTAGAVCANQFEEGSARLQARPAEDVARAFNTCAPISSTADLFNLHWTIAEGFGGQAQEDLPPNFIVTQICQEMDRLITSGVGADDAMAQTWNALVSPGSCTDFSTADMIDSMSNVTVDGNLSGGRAWMFQTCTDVGYFQSAYKGTSPFFSDLPVETIIAFCGEIFGVPGMVPDVDGFNRRYGGKAGLRPRVPLLVTNGLLDPWHLLSITESRPGIKAVTYQAGHCAPLHANTTNDPISLRKAREAISMFVTNLLRD